MLKYCIIIIIIIQHCILKINRDDEVAFSVKKNPKTTNSSLCKGSTEFFISHLDI